MVMQELGRIEEVGLREVWNHEELDFTPWLAGNLDLLGDALDLTLELAHTEASVGSYYLDLLAEETQYGGYVAIENQIEETDHDHLGKLLTYAAGREAQYVIWVASRFRPEHVAAIGWLNDLAPDKVWFYAVQIRVIKIGNSYPAPEFRLVASPKNQKSDSQRYYEFFQPLMTRLLLEGFTGRDQHRALSQHYQEFFWKVGASSNETMGYGVTIEEFSGTSKASVYLWIKSKDAEWNRRVFESLKKHQDRIESEIGAEPEWDNGDTWGFPSVSLYIDGSIEDPPEKLEEIREWIRENLIRFRSVFNPCLETILAELEGEQ